MTATWRKTFQSAYGEPTPAKALAQFAQQGFLIVDSIPFAMDYSSKRALPKYEELVCLTARTYLQEKLNSSVFSWSSDVRIAFSVYRNALAIMKGLGAELNLGGKQFVLSPELIAVNRAGYPDAEKLSAICERIAKQPDLIRAKHQRQKPETLM